MTDTRICPYCTKTYEVDSEDDSKDHIFSGFLGGTRRIPACKGCNKYFGDGFEGRVSHNIHTWHVIMTNWGIKFKTNIPAWKSAKTDKEDLYLSVTDNGIEATLAKPVIEKAEDGSFKTGTYGIRKVAEQALKSLIAKGKVDESTQILESPGTPENRTIKFSFEFTSDLHRLILKMCSSYATWLPEFDLDELGLARQYLVGANMSGPVRYIRYSFDEFEEINASRPPMSHIIYIERNELGTFGLVQFFGVFQFICKLGAASVKKEDHALFAFLDPITGEERFTDFKQIGVKSVPPN